MSEVRHTQSVMYGLSKIAHLCLVFIFIMIPDRMSMTADTTDLFFSIHISVVIFQNEAEYQIP